MFVRWRRRKYKRSLSGAGVEHGRYAEVVKAVRVNGKPRQKVVRYLASIDESRMADAWSRRYFWRDVEKAVSGLQIDERSGAAIAKRLRDVVPFPAPEQLARDRSELARLERLHECSGYDAAQLFSESLKIGAN